MVNSMAGLETLSAKLGMDAHQPAPEELKQFFKKYTGRSIDTENLFDITTINAADIENMPSGQREKAFAVFNNQTSPSPTPQKVYKFTQIPGLTYLPELLPATIQTELLDRLLHRDLFNSRHQTNLHAHYHVTYKEEDKSFFNGHPDDLIQPKDPAVHKPLHMRKVLNEKLRWVTLGGQYNWTDKVYPLEAPPKFPIDVASLLHHLFPDMEPQAAIVNLYSPGDRLNMHRDVSEEIYKGLASISLGCSCIFIIGIENEDTHEIQKVALRLKSGDALFMSGESRLAWHGVAKIENETCPEFLCNWPGEKEYPNWKNWMKGKRINLNVRQMRDAELDESDYILGP